VAEVAELAAVSEMVAVKQAGRGGRDENCQQARQRKNRGKANRETPKWTVDLHLLLFGALCRRRGAIARAGHVNYRLS
jgi:hypothetical protein